MLLFFPNNFLVLKSAQSEIIIAVLIKIMKKERDTMSLLNNEKY